MNVLDFAVIGLLLAGMAWGVHTGFTIQVGLYVGLVGGTLLGARAAVEVAKWSSSSSGQMLLALVTVTVVATVIGTIGSQVGGVGARWVRRGHLGVADAALGGGFATAGILAMVWLLAGSLATLPRADIGPLIQDSRIVRWLDATLPPLPDVAARLGRITDPLGLPRVFAGLQRAPSTPVAAPTDAQLRAAAALATTSTVKVRGVGCGAELLGSGFVVAPDLVMTNAHVIAGAADLTVSDANGSHRAVALTFDPRYDIAILSTRGLAGKPLALTGPAPSRGATGATLGYPNGGGLVVEAAAVRATYDAVGRDIYGTGLVTRSIVELQARVAPGDSGGPLVLADGTVGGVVFARSVTDSAVGYAISPSTARSSLTAARTRAGTVSTGPCAAG